MTPKHLFILFLALFATTVAQSDDELHIPVENDNQFPPDKHSELDVGPTEGSGAEEPLEPPTPLTESPLLEDVQLTSTLINNDISTTSAAYVCPTKCVCNVEGNSNQYIVDCSGAELTELPTPLDPRTTELNLQNNKLTEIPKDISALKDLKILNANNNGIMDLVPGSISELSELTSLKLGNNRLMEYPTDLKNSFGLTKLEELDLGGNDMRTALKTETFSTFKALRKLTLPSAAAELVEDVCAALKESLETVCTESCNNKSFDCPDAPDITDDLDFVLPGLIALATDPEANEDLITSTISNIKIEPDNKENAKPSESVNEETTTTNTTAETGIVSAPTGDGLFRTSVLKAATEESNTVEAKSNPDDAKPELAQAEAQPTEASKSNLTEAEPTSKVATKTEEEVVGATTSNTKTGGVDKSIIGIIVAGMVLVVAGITIKKNWSSIRNRFSSSPRSADRTAVNANGTTPEEVPLQDKSPA